MSEYVRSSGTYNPWDLKELEYSGELYHYTNVSASRGIFCHKDCPDYPEGCISLRFKRIDCMKKNDPNERTHIDNAVKKIVQKLSSCGKVSEHFAKAVCDYKPTNKGIYRLATDEIDSCVSKAVISYDFGPLDYYVACFSTNPSNAHIVTEFKAPIRITFNSDFSRRCADPFSREASRVDTSGRFLDFSNTTYPLQSIRECFSDTYLRRVEYVDTSAGENEIKSDLIEKKLLNIFERVQKASVKEKIQEEIENMYSLCDAFVKDIAYKPEEEVRFVIRLPQRDFFLKKNDQFPKLLTDNHFVFDADRTYLQLPISDEFISL